MNPLWYYIRATLAITLIFGSSLVCVFAEFPALIFKIFSRLIYRHYVRLVERCFGSLLVITIHWFSPATFIITGDVDCPIENKRTVVMANHQIYADWVYLWIWARFKKAHGDIKIILKHDLIYIPIIGTLSIDLLLLLFY